MATDQSSETVEYRSLWSLGYPGYRVGNDGSVWSCWCRVGLGQGYGTICATGSRWRRLKPSPHKCDGHMRVTLGSMGRRFVHQLVLEAFVGPCPEGMVACHDPDRDPANNRLSNLRWDTQKANIADAVRHGTKNPAPPRPGKPKGERHGNAKLSDAMVQAIFVFRKAGKTLAEIATTLRVTKQTVWRVVHRKSWAHVQPTAPSEAVTITAIS
jgi:hypothetical protein